MQHTIYHPAPHVLDRLKKVTLVAVIGPTAVGKSTLISAALARDPQIHLVLTNTSREPRPGERQGTDYIFRSHDDMLRDMEQGIFVQVAPSAFGDLYATTAHEYNVDGVAVMAILADAMPDFRALPFKEIRSIFVLPPDLATWQARITNHGFDASQLRRRLVEAERSFVYATEDEQVRFVINDSLTASVEDFMTLAHAKRLPPRLKADQSRGRELIGNLLDGLRQTLAAHEDRQ